MRSRGERVRSIRSASRRLTRRLIAESPGQIILVCFVCTIAIATGVIAHAYALEATERLERVGERRHGSISVEVGGETAVPSLPAVSHAPDRRLHWFNDSLARQIEESARAVGSRLLRRIELAAYDSTDTVRTVIAVGPDDPGLELLELEQGRNGAGGPAGSRSPDLTVAIARRPDETVEWHTIPTEAVHGVSRDGTVWVRYSWVRSLVGASPVANVLVAAEPTTNPFSVAYDLAYDLSQQLASADAATRVFAWPELVGYQRYVGTGSAASMLRPLALAVAAVGVVGAVAVASRSRVRDAVLLRTIGFETGVVRGVYVREIAIASITASLLVLAALLVASRFGLSVEIDAQIRRTLIGGALIPPVVAFLTVHRHLRAPLATVRREIDQ